MADPLRDKIAAIVEKHTVLGAPTETANEIAALVRSSATSDAAVEAAARGTYASNRWNRRTKLGVFEPIPWEELAADEHATRIIEARAAITAALGGGDG